MSCIGRFATALAVAGCAVVVNGCGGAGPAPTSPSSAQTFVIMPPPMPDDPNAISLQLDQTTTGTIGGDGPWCSMVDPIEGPPCQNYSVTVDRPTAVTVRITWSTPDETLCAIGGRADYFVTCGSTSPVERTYTVEAGRFLFAVGLEASGGPLPGGKVTYTVMASTGNAVAAGERR